MAENQKVGITINVNGTEKVLGSMKEIKTEMKKAREEVILYSSAFGESAKETQNAIDRVTQLEDAIGDAKLLTESFNPDKKFVALGGAIQGVTAGFSAVQGAIGVFSDKSEAVEKVLLKVNSAMALQQGISGVFSSIDAFKLMGKELMATTLFQKANSAATVIATAVQRAFGVAVVGTGRSFNILKGAIVSTGIGALVVVIGILIDKMGLLGDETDSAKDAQERLNQALERQNQLLQDNLDELDYVTKAQIARAKIAGKSEAEITGIAKKGSDERLKLLKDAYEQGLAIEDTADFKKLKLEEQDKIRKDNTKKQKDYLNESAKIELEGLEKQASATEKARQTAKEKSDKRIADDKAKREKNAEDIVNANKELDKRLLDLQQEYAELSSKNEQEKALKSLEAERDNAIKEIEQSVADATKKEEAIAEVKKIFELKKNESDEEFRKKEEKRVAEYQSKLSDIQNEIKLAKIKDEREREKEELAIDLEEKIADINKDETLKEDERLKLILALKERNSLAVKELEDKYALEDATKQLDALNKIISDEDSKYQVKLDAINKEKALVEDLHNKKLITDDDYLKRKKEISDAEVDVDKKKKEALEKNAQSISGLLGNLANVFGKQTAMGKTFAVAQAIMDTYASATKAFKSMADIPVVGPALGTVAAGAAIASGIKNVKEIIKVKVPNGGGSSASVPSVSTPAPITPPSPQASITQLDQTSINKLGSATSRAYVVESDITNSQERITRINRASRLN